MPLWRSARAWPWCCRAEINHACVGGERGSRAASRWPWLWCLSLFHGLLVDSSFYSIDLGLSNLYAGVPSSGDPLGFPVARRIHTCVWWMMINYLMHMTYSCVFPVKRGSTTTTGIFLFICFPFQMDGWFSPSRRIWLLHTFAFRTLHSTSHTRAILKPIILKPIILNL
jgi:hypothetical protein